MRIPVLRPKLPQIDKALPYLRRIDETRLYSNFGPLNLELEHRLADHFKLPEGGVVTVANATLGLTAALNASRPRAGGQCLMPAWTFVASPHAAVLAGLRPYFLDLEAEEWTITCDQLRRRLPSLQEEPSAMMPVVPFGETIDLASWDKLAEQTGIPVIVDAAAGFDGLRPGRSPCVVSLHATKAVGAGEGGFVASSDIELMKRVRACTNFGFYGSRNALYPAANAKLSEYSAAFALAALDEWPIARAEFLNRGQKYRSAFTVSNSGPFRPGFAEEWISSTCVITLPDGSAADLGEALAKEGIETRQWWGRGAHAHPATGSFGHDSVPVTERVSASAIGLPFFRDLTDAAIRTVAEVVSHTLRRS
jgi:dTDP-4-amino-4,6-dideoxygalactose transaminase